tara:strand:- start:5662 stop:6375 length:714 start_codon:yes stop_codon:yes gene_type:complete
MANVSAYKALGKSLGQYRKNLTAMDKADVESDLIAFEASEDRAMTDTLTRTVAEIAGIAQEKLALSQDIQMGREAPGVYGQIEKYQPLGKIGEFIGLDEKQRTVYKSRETGATLDINTLSQIGIMERLGLTNKYSDYKIPTAPERPKVIESNTMQPDSADDNVAYTALKEYNTSLMNKPITSTSSPSLTDRSRGVVDLFGRQTGGMNTTAVESTAVGIKPNNNRVFDFLENIFKRGN